MQAMYRYSVNHLQVQCKKCPLIVYSVYVIPYTVFSFSSKCCLPQAVDSAKNTPLHVIVLYKKIVSDFLTLHAIILALLESGWVKSRVICARFSPIQFCPGPT